MDNLSRVVAALSIAGIIVGNAYTYFPQAYQPILDSLSILRSVSIFDLAGMLGVCFYIGSYIALQANKIEGTSVPYCAANGIAACLVLTSLVQDFNLASVTIQIVWILVSVFGISRYYSRRGSSDFNRGNANHNHNKSETSYEQKKTYSRKAIKSQPSSKFKSAKSLDALQARTKDQYATLTPLAMRPASS